MSEADALSETLGSPTIATDPAAPEIDRPGKRPGKVAIMRAAVEVMGERGYEGASTRDMALRAGVSVAALYHHFPSKLDLLQEFLEESYDITLSRLIRRLGDADQSPPAQLDELVATMMASYLHNEFARLAAYVAFHEFKHLPAAQSSGVERKRQKMLKMATDIVAAGVKTGDFDVQDPREAARAIVALALSLVESFGETKRSMPQMIKLYQGFARGIVTSG